MLREEFDHGFPETDWDFAKEEARKVMIDKAKTRDIISYSELVRRITRIRLEPRDPRLFHFLGVISSEEDEAGRGMLTVVVVHKSGDMQPGPGFFELAEKLGRDTSDINKCWVEELRRVYDYWSK